MAYVALLVVFRGRILSRKRYYSNGYGIAKIPSQETLTFEEVITSGETNLDTANYVLKNQLKINPNSYNDSEIEIKRFAPVKVIRSVNDYMVHPYIAHFKKRLSLKDNKNVLYFLDDISEVLNVIESENKQNIGEFKTKYATLSSEALVALNKRGNLNDV